METIRLIDGRVVSIGLRRTTPGKMLSAHGMHVSAAPPESCINSNGYQWQMDYNDQEGDCVSAYLANWISMVTGAKISAATMQRWVLAHGYQNGANILEAIQVLGRDPMSDDAGNQYTVGGPLGVDYGDDAAVQAAIYQYKGLDLGIDASVLQAVVGSSNGWVLHGLKRQYSNINHSVGNVDYGDYKTLAGYFNAKYNVSMPNVLGDSTPCATLGTWGTLGIVELASQKLAVGESWAIQGVNLNPAPTPGPTPDPTPTPNPTPGPCPWRQQDVEAFAHSITRGVARALRSINT